jgi:SET domain-containing protein
VPIITMIDIGLSCVHGKGAFASKDLFEDDRIGVYEGRRYTARQAGRRNWDSGLTYVFGLTDGTVIDAANGGNATRHLNHSCAPNCIAYEEVTEGGRMVIAFYALRDIRAGEELFIDYSLDVDESEDRTRFGCACGADVCRGTMLAAA